MNTLKHRGFSLLELVIVMAIIGLLAGLAIPNYQHYITKAKMLDLFVQTHPIQLTITEALITQTPIEKINNQSLGMDAIVQEGMAEHISFKNAIITIQGNAKRLGISSSPPLIIQLEPIIKIGKIEWNCLITPVNLKTYAPAYCQ